MGAPSKTDGRENLWWETILNYLVYGVVLAVFLGLWFSLSWTLIHY